MTDELKMMEQQIPTLTLDPLAAEKPVEEAKPEVTPVVLDDSFLTEAEKKVVNDFAQQIDLTNSTMILQYGSAAQKKLSDFSESALESVRTKDLGEVGEMITDLVVELKDFDADEEKKGLLGFFKKGASRINALKARYDKAEINVNKIVSALEGHQVQLLKDIALMDQMYERNTANYKELSMYILAGKKKLADVRENVLPQMIEKAKATGEQEDHQAANDMASFCDRFEKKLHDLELTRMISIQMSPQIRLVQNSNTLMAEKIQSTLNNTIPLWKNQMVLALGMAHTKEALEAQRKVNQTTNNLLRQNAETLRSETIEIAQESERGIVDLETIRHTNEQLLSTLDEVLAIQQDGRRKRLEAENEMIRIEEQLKRKLLDFQS